MSAKILIIDILFFNQKGAKLMDKIKMHKKFASLTLAASMVGGVVSLQRAVSCHGWDVWETTTARVGYCNKQTPGNYAVEVSTPMPLEGVAGGCVMIMVKLGDLSLNGNRAPLVNFLDPPRITPCAGSGDYRVSWAPESDCWLVEGEAKKPLHLKVECPHCSGNKKIMLSVGACTVNTWMRSVGSQFTDNKLMMRVEDLSDIASYDQTSMSPPHPEDM
jgi:hypothetical protein